MNDFGPRRRSQHLLGSVDTVWMEVQYATRKLQKAAFLRRLELPAEERAARHQTSNRSATNRGSARWEDIDMPIDVAEMIYTALMLLLVGVFILAFPVARRQKNLRGVTSSPFLQSHSRNRLLDQWHEVAKK